MPRPIQKILKGNLLQHDPDTATLCVEVKIEKIQRIGAGVENRK